MEASCPHCNCVVYCDDTQAGQPVECPRCSKSFKMPSPAAQAALPPVQSALPQVQAVRRVQSPVQGKSQLRVAFWLFAFLFLGAGFAVAFIFGLYWWSTVPVRLEKKAAEELQRRTRLESTFLRKDGSQPVSLTGGEWAKERIVVRNESTEWDLQPSESRAYPFDGIITIRYRRWATVYHDSKEAAEADDLFYRASNSMFYEKAGGYTDWDVELTLTSELRFDATDGHWVERRRKKE